MTDPVKPRILVLGAGFGGLELATVLSDAAGDRLDITLIVPAATLGVGEAFASMGAMDKTAQDARRLIDDYEEAGVTRIIVGLVDYTEESGLRHLERAAKGLRLT